MKAKELTDCIKKKRRFLILCKDMYLENFIQRLRYKINIKYQDIRELTN